VACFCHQCLSIKLGNPQLKVYGVSGIVAVKCLNLSTKGWPTHAPPPTSTWVSHCLGWGRTPKPEAPTGHVGITSTHQLGPVRGHRLRHCRRNAHGWSHAKVTPTATNVSAQQNTGACRSTYEDVATARIQSRPYRVLRSSAGEIDTPPSPFAACQQFVATSNDQSCQRHDA